MVLLAAAGLFVWYLGLGLSADERDWLFTRRVRDREPFSAFDDDDVDPVERPARTKVVPPAAAPRTLIADRVKQPDTGARTVRERQPSLALGDNYVLPTLDLLNPPPAAGQRDARQGRRSNATRGCSNRCSTISRSRARSSRSGPARW